MFPQHHPYASVPNKRQFGPKPSPEEKWGAIQQVRHGATKAEVARSMNVPESTLRGWCKNAEKIQYVAHRESLKKRPSTDGSVSSTLSDNSNQSHTRSDEPQRSVSYSGCSTLPTGMEVTQFTNPTNGTVAQPYRPWTANLHNTVNMNASALSQPGMNHLPSSPAHSPISLTHTPPLWPYGKRNECVEYQSVVKSRKPKTTKKVSLGSDLPADLSVRPTPAVRTPNTKRSSSNSDSNNNIAVATPVRGSHKKYDNIMDPLEAFRCAQLFYGWFETYSDPTITAQDFSKFQDLLERVRQIAERPQPSSVAGKNKN